MKTNALSPEKLADLNPLVQELLVGARLDLPSIPIDILLALGDNIIKFLALIISNKYLSKDLKNSNIDSYLGQLFENQRGLDSYISISVLQECSLVDPEHNIISDAIVLDHNIDKWIELRKKIHNIRSPKVIEIRYRVQITTLVEVFYSYVDNFCGEKSVTGNNFIFDKDKYSVPVSPFFIIEKCSQCSQIHLFAFQLYNSESGKFRFKCWGNGHSLIVEETSCDLFHNLQVAEKKKRSTNIPEHYSEPLWPFFNIYLPDIAILVNLLFKETTIETKKNIWLSFVPIPELEKDENFVKNRILLDIIERGPVAVMRDVAQLEGKDELPGYIKILLENKKNSKEIEHEIVELDKKCKKIFKERFELPGIPSPKIDDNDPEFIKIKVEVFSIKVVELLDFKIEEMPNISYVEYFRNKIIKAISFYSRPEWKDVSFYNMTTVVIKLFYELEMCYKELVHFYRYLYEIEIQKSKELKSFTDSLETIFSLDRSLREMYENFSSINDNMFYEIFGNGNGITEKCIFDISKYDKVLKINDAKGSIFDLKKALYIENNENPYLQDDNRDTLLLILCWIKEIYDFFLDNFEKNRLFPYKIFFTTSSETRHFSDAGKTLRGIRTCQYFTYIENDNYKGEILPMKIYTDQDINLKLNYYCLPHPNRSRNNYWLEPMLIPIKAVGFVTDCKEPDYEKLKTDEYQQKGPFIFISYAHADIEKVKPDIIFLKNSNYQVFWDNEIPHADDWDTCLSERLHSCERFIVYLSKNSTEKDSFVLKEISRADRKKKKFFIIFLEDVDPPMKLEGKQSILKYDKKYEDNKLYLNEFVKELGEECKKK